MRSGCVGPGMRHWGGAGGTVAATTAASERVGCMDWT